MNVPSSLRAGDTIEWTESSSDYPAGNGYTLAIDLRAKDKAPITITASANGNDYDVAIPSTTSKNYNPGLYHYQAYVCKSDNGTITEKHTLQTGQITILPNITDVGTQTELRSTVKQILDDIETVMKLKAQGGDISGYSIAGRSASKYSWTELIQMRSHFQGEVQSELEAENIGKGLDSGKQIGVRFRRI